MEFQMCVMIRFNVFTDWLTPNLINEKKQYTSKWAIWGQTKGFPVAIKDFCGRVFLKFAWITSFLVYSVYWNLILRWHWGDQVSFLSSKIRKCLFPIFQSGRFFLHFAIERVYASFLYYFVSLLCPCLFAETPIHLLLLHFITTIHKGTDIRNHKNDDLS